MTHGPTHQFCPKCNAMLPPHLVECPRCGQNLAEPSVDISAKEVFQLTGAVLLLALIPLVVIIGVAALCLAVAR